MKNSVLTIMVRILALAVIIGIAGASCAPRVEEELSLTYGVDSFGGHTLDPMVATEDDTAILACMFDGLFTIGADGKLAPGIVKEWEIAPDGLSWTLRLRDDVIFHDGSKMTAEDIAFSLESSVREGTFKGGDWRSMLGDKPHIEVVDKYTVRVYTNGPQAFINILATNLYEPKMFVLPKAYIEKNGWEYFSTHPIGTGPYKFVRCVPSDSIEFEAVDYDHWRGVVPDFKRIKVLLIPEETTRIFMFEKGLVDIIPVGMESAKELKGKGFRTASGTTASVFISFIGTYLPEAAGMPLADKKVRQALSLAVNRQEIIDTMFGGIGSVPTGTKSMSLTDLDWTPYLVGKWGPWFKENNRYDPDEARRLLQEAGYGKGLTFSIWVCPDPDAPFLADVTTAVCGYWSEIGVKAEIVSVDAAAWKAARHTLNSKKLVGQAGSSAVLKGKPPSIKRIDWWTAKTGSMNLFHGSPAETKVDALYKEGMSATDPASYEHCLNEALEIITDSWTSIGIVDAPLTFAVGPRVEVIAPPNSTALSALFLDWKYIGVKP